MKNLKKITKHDRIQKEIITACKNIGNVALQEYAGKGWRADVFVPNFGKPLAFEIQISPQSLKKTLERQAKYIRDGILGCWLFENPIPKFIEERPDLPVFYVEEEQNGSLSINLGNRRKVNLQVFLENFISKNIQFKTIAKTKKIQLVNLVFYDMKCWKCGELNYLYYVEKPFYSACNAKLSPEEALWDSSSIEYKPEFIRLSEKFVEERKDINLAKVKERFSHTVGTSYQSFGCHKCDSIFGDFYVMDAKLEVMYDLNKLTYQGEIEFPNRIELEIPHWCFPEDRHFCDED